MNLWQAFLLGVVQGVAEFLPVSSSGHLAIFQQFLNITEPTLVFDVFLHAISLIVIISFFWQKILKISFKEVVYLGLATIPAVLIGLFLEDKISYIFSDLFLVSLALILTGFFNLISNELLSKEPGSRKAFGWLKRLANKDREKLDSKKATLIGVFQSLALIPGISRSGTTLLGSLTQNIDREEAFNFTFLLAIPAIAGASLLQIIKLLEGNIETVAPNLFIVGGIGAFIASYYSLTLLKKLITEARLAVFGWYCLIAGSTLFIFSLVS